MRRARAPQALTSVLTLRYAPLEQHHGQHQGPWTDIYSLGAVAYWTLSGEEPDVATVRVEEDSLRPLSSLTGGGVSDELSSAVDAALQVFGRDRPRSVEEWRALLDGGAGQAKAVGSPGGEVGVEGKRSARAGPASSRRWWPAAAAAVLAALVLVVALAVSWSGMFSRDQGRPDAAASTAATPAATLVEGGEVAAGEGSAEAPPGDGEASTAAAFPPAVAPPGEAGEERREERSGEASRPSPEAVEVQLGLDRSARRQIQEGLRASGLDPGAADGLFGPGTRAALREWQSTRGMPATGYLDPPSVAALRAAREEAARVEAEREAEAERQAELEAQRQVWLEAQRQAELEAQRQAELEAQRFRDCTECPEMVVLPGGGLAMGRYEVTVGEYRAFVSATGAGGGCYPGFMQTDRHPVACVSWDDAQEYVSWLSRRTGAAYRLPTEAEWERAVDGSPDGVGCGGRSTSEGSCPVGSYGVNTAGLSDMVGNQWEWTSDCREGDCVVRGGAFFNRAEDLRPGIRVWRTTATRGIGQGFRVSRTLD